MAKSALRPKHITHTNTKQEDSQSQHMHSATAPSLDWLSGVKSISADFTIDDIALQCEVVVDEGLFMYGE